MDARVAAISMVHVLIINKERSVLDNILRNWFMIGGNLGCLEDSLETKLFTTKSLVKQIGGLSKLFLSKN